MLTLGLLERNTGIATSTRLGIDDPTAAFAFDLAVTYRLLRFDNTNEADRSKLLVRLMGGEESEDDS